MSTWLSLYYRWRRFQVVSLLYPLLCSALCMAAVPVLVWVTLQ